MASKHQHKPHPKPNPPKPASTITAKPPNPSENVKVETVKSDNNSSLVLPEQMSLSAHEHIQEYLKTYKKQKLDKNDLTAVLRLSQHLRVFGLLSAVGYLNQANAQDNNEVRKRTVPVWELLLGQMVDQAPSKEEMMTQIVDIARNKPQEYMLMWRKSLLLANHWNFWARAYQED
jgi:heme-binding NEAT domain protein